MPRLTVLGIGNPIMTDDGVGIAILEQLQRIGPPPGDYAGTELCYVDGGTSGMEILPDIEDADFLLVLDALAGLGESGEVHTFIGDQIPRLLQAKLSPHQVGLLDLLSVARLQGYEPTRIAVIGVVVEDTSLHVGLTESVSAAVMTAAETAKRFLLDWL